jgi:hypothetical protein
MRRVPFHEAVIVPQTSFTVEDDRSMGVRVLRGGWEIMRDAQLLFVVQGTIQATITGT